MTLEELRAILKASGLPAAYRAFRENSAPPLPFICYQETGSDNTGADGIVWFSARQVDVELYTAYKDPEAEQKVEAALTAAGIYYDKYETYIDSEKMYQITYEIEV